MSPDADPPIVTADPPTAAGDGETATRPPDGLPPTDAGPGPAGVIGTVVAGRYKLLEPLGEGGMGAVFLARQTEPVRRFVALKVVRAGFDSKQVLARFEAERQAVALMDHPNIAKVLDAGMTAEGRPFFVMELVAGVPVTAYCDAHRLTTRERLELFVPVCRAVQHAHQKGVIHRDIKPSNVLVAVVDDRPVPKVIDFGVAKAAGPPLTDSTLVTGVGAVVGTPEYMSPEQASLDRVDVDTRSDVYALGVLLYELLTGSTPVDRKALGRAAVLEVLRVVREVEAPRPSAKLSAADGLAGIAARRGTEPRTLCRLLRGELDWVALKALEKDRARRYDTANALARDVERYLADEVVEARPPSATYRVRKLVRRNKGRVAAAGLVLLALVLGLAGATWGLVEARRHERAAERQRVAAEARRAEAEAVLAFFQDHVFAAARPKGVRGGLGHDVTLRAAITAALPALAAGFADQPLVEARLCDTVGLTFMLLGEADAATAQFGRARAVRADRLGPDDPDTLASAHHLALAHANARRWAEALALNEQTLAARERVLGPDDPDTLTSMHSLAVTYAFCGRVPEALALHEQTLAARRRVLGPDNRDTLTSMDSVASTYTTAAQLPAALKLRRETLAARERVLGPDDPDTLTSMNNLADTLNDLGQHPEALTLARKAADRARERLGPDNPKTVFYTLTLAETLVAIGPSAEAVSLLDECAVQAARPSSLDLFPAIARARLAHFRKANDPAGCRDTAERWERLNRTGAAALYDAARNRSVASGVYTRAGQPAEAAADADRAVGWLKKAVAAGYKNADHMAADPDLAPLRGRADFQKLVDDLKAQPPRGPGRRSSRRLRPGTRGG